MNTTDTPQSKRQWWRIATWFMISAFTLLLLTIAGSAWWLWGWQWNSGLNFHDSWTAEERTALTQFEQYIHTKLAEDMGLVTEAVQDSIDKINEDSELAEEESDDVWDEEAEAESRPKESASFATRLTIAMLLKLQIAPIDAALHELAATGKGAPAEPISTPAGDNVTPALLAAQIGDFPALKAFINHGASPNAMMTRNGKEMECILAPLLNGMFINSRTIPWEQRCEMLNFLHEHGANLNLSKEIVPHSLRIALLAREEPQAWLWALEHGKKVSTTDFCDMLESIHGMDLVEHVLAEKLVNVNDVSGKRTPLQALAEGMLYADAESIDSARYEERLNLLLAAGATPNLTTEHTPRTPLEILQSRTNFERSDGMPENSCCMDGPDIRCRWQLICNKLWTATYSSTDIDTESDNEEEQ